MRKDEPLDDEQLRLKKVAFLQVHEALGLRMNGALHMVANRMKDVREADSLGDGRLADRARRKTLDHLAGAQTKLDSEIERTIDKHGFREEWDDFSSIPDGAWQEIEGLLDSDSDVECQEWRGSLNAAIPPQDYVQAAERLLGANQRPSIPEWAWDLMASILGALKFPQDTDEYAQLAAAAFDLFLAETWDEIDPRRVDELIDEGFASANRQRAEIGKPMLSVSTPKTRFSATAMWWVSDRSGAFTPLRSYVESQPAYSRLMRTRSPLFGDDPNIETVWSTGIASAVSWLFVAKEEPIAES